MTAEARPPRITAVVVTYRSAATIAAALAPLRQAQAAGWLDCVVVDNDSPDATPALLERERGWAKVLLTGRNQGFGRGCNLGAAEARTPYVVFVNPDAVVDGAVLTGLADFLDQHPEAGIAGPAIREGDGDQPQGLQTTGLRMTPWRLLREALPLLPKRPLHWPIQPGSPPQRTGWVCGAVLMIRTQLFAALGGFDPRFFLYWEEIDLCKRAEAAGGAVYAVGTAVARHVGGASTAADDTKISGCIARHYYQSRHYYLRKHHGWLPAVAAELGEYACLLLRTTGDLLAGRGARRLKPRRQAPLCSQPDPVA